MRPTRNFTRSRTSTSYERGSRVRSPGRRRSSPHGADDTPPAGSALFVQIPAGVVGVEVAAALRRVLGVVEQHALLGQLHFVHGLELVIQPSAGVGGAGPVELGLLLVETEPASSRSRGSSSVVELVEVNQSSRSSASLMAASAYGPPSHFAHISGLGADPVG